MDPRGALYALAAYGAWGLAPLFWKQLDGIPSSTVLAHRVAWAAVLFLLLLAWRRRLRELPGALRRQLGTFVLSAGLIAVNWFVFLYCIERELILQASLGYFINPLVNVLLGLVFLREHLSVTRWAAVLLAALGVLLLWQEAGTFPLLSLVLAFSFGFYGLVRKTAGADALLGSNVETLLLTPFAVAWILGPAASAASGVETSGLQQLFLVLSGAMTALPLLWFSNAARRLPYSTLGFFQYLAPTGQFLLAVLVYGEPFSSAQLRAFLLIWLALAVFMTEARLRARHRRALSAPPAR